MLPPIAPPTHFVGRSRELERCRAGLDAAQSGQGSLLMLAGEAGIGKTALAQQVVAEARHRGATVLWGASYEGDWRPAYGPWAQALTQFVHAFLPLRAEGSQEQSRLDVFLGPGMASLAHLVPELRTRFPDVTIPAHHPEEDRLRLYDALAQWLLAAATWQAVPLLLVLDDLHWADGDSLRALRYVARFAPGAPMLILGIYRDPDLDSQHNRPFADALAALQREPGYTRLLLRGFTPPETATYLQEEGEPLPQAVVNALHGETAGNPFYLRQIMRHLIEEDKIIRRASGWSTDFSIAELGIPDGVRQVVARRCARLSDTANLVLRVAAAFTHGFNFRQMQTVTALADETLLDVLDEAHFAGLLRPLEQMPDHVPASTGQHAHEFAPTTRHGYEFSHAIVRHTLYAEMNLDRRMRLHRRIALALEQSVASDDMDSVVGAHGELAFQYYASAGLPDAEQGVPHCVAAAAEARAAYAYEQAVLFLRMARDLAARLPPRDRSKILCRLALDEAAALDLEGASQSAQAALATLAEIDADEARDDVRTTEAMTEFAAAIARALKEAGAPPAHWTPLMERGLALLGDRRDLTWARLQLLRPQIEVISDQEIFMSRWAGFAPQAVAIARSQGDEEDYANTLEPFDARTPQETAAVLALARGWQRPYAILRGLDLVARDLIYRHGDIRAAQERLYELLDAGERYGSISARAEALLQLSLCQAMLGDLDQAPITLDSARGFAARLGTTHRLRALATTAMQCIIAEYAGGDYAALAEETTRIATSPNFAQGLLGFVAANFAVLNHVYAGNRAQALRLLHLLAPLIQQMPRSVYLYNGGLDRHSAAAWYLNIDDHAALYRGLALDLLEDGLPGSPLHSNALTVARMAALLGDAQQATTYFAHARIERNWRRTLRSTSNRYRFTASHRLQFPKVSRFYF